MKTMDVQKILGLLQGCHSILGLCWPRPGVAQMAGSRIFIGTKSFVALEDGIRQTNVEFTSLCELPNLQTACQAWRLVTDIIAGFRVLGRESQSTAIDPAYNLIYLTTGILYHHIASIFSVVPKHVQPYATVEPLEKLLSDCSWEHDVGKVETAEILKSLANKMRESLAEIQK